MATVTENKLLIWSALEKMTGGNNHSADQLIQSYRYAIDIYRDRRCTGKKKKEAKEAYIRAERALHEFVYEGSTNAVDHSQPSQRRKGTIIERRLPAGRHIDACA